MNRDKYEAAARMLDDAHGRSVGSAARRLDLRDLACQSAPPRPWVRSRWLGAGVTLLAGAGGHGKSTLVQHEATCGALGRPYFTEACEPYRSLVWNCEDGHDDLWRRQESICAHERIDFLELADLEKLHIESRVGCDNALMVSVNRSLCTTPLMTELHQQVNDLRVDVLWLDNAAHFLAADHDNRTEVTAFVNALNGLVTGRLFSIVITGHISRAEGSEFTGSVAWENASRMRWYLGKKLPDQRGDDAGDGQADATRFLANRKSNYSAADHVKLTMTDAGLLVPISAPGHVGAIAARLDEEHAEAAVIAGFTKLAGMGIAATDSANSGDNLCKQMIAKGLSQGHTRADLTRALNRLMQRGEFSRGVVGHYANRTPKPGLVRRDGCTK